MSEQFLTAYAVDVAAMRDVVGSNDGKLVARALRKPTADDVEELLGERDCSVEEVLGEILAGKLVAKHAYVYRRTLELVAGVVGTRLRPDEITLPGRGWQDLGRALEHWGAKRLAAHWGGDWPWPWRGARAPKGAAVDWPLAFVVPRKEAGAIAKELRAIDAKLVMKRGVPKGIPRFSDAREWPLEPLAAEVAGLGKTFGKWCAALAKHPGRDLLVLHDGQS